MSSPVASLPPPTAPVRHFPDPENEPLDTGTMEFRELWADKERGLTFADVLDIVNPLQHIPVVSTLYRAITGDELGLGARLIGGALFGGGVGLALGIAQAAVENATGRDIGAHMLAAVQDIAGGGAADAPRAMAAATATPQTLSALAPAAGPPAAMAEAAPAATPPPAAPPPAAGPGRIESDRVAAREFPARDEKPRPVLGASPSEKARIAEAVERARRAQAAMLFAGAADPLPAPGADADRDADAPREKASEAKRVAVSATPAAQPSPAPVHPNMIPANASPEWLARAMERALSKYEDTLRLRSR